MGVWKVIEDSTKKNAIAISTFEHTDSHTLNIKIGDRLELKGECNGKLSVYIQNFQLKKRQFLCIKRLVLW